MTTLLKASLLNHGKKYFFKMKDMSSILNNIKTDYSKSQVTSSYIIKRCITTEKTDKSETFPHTVIYKGMLSNHIKSIKLFSMATSLLGIVGWPVVYYTDSYSILNSKVMALTLTGIAVYSLSTPFIIHTITKRYVKKMEYDAYNDKYIATVYSLFCKEQQIEFKLEDVQKLENPTMFTTIKVKGKPIFFDTYSFNEPEHCKRLLAYDEPIDFKLNDIVDIDNESVKEPIKQQNKI